MMPFLSSAACAPCLRSLPALRASAPVPPAGCCSSSVCLCVGLLAGGVRRAFCVASRRAFAFACVCVIVLCVRLRAFACVRLRHCACVQGVSRRLVVVVRRCVVLGLLCRFGGLLWCGLCVALCWGCVVLGLWLGVLQIAVCVFLCCVLCTVYYYYYLLLV